MLSRRRFLSGKFSPAADALRPPWHIAEADFTARCTRCTDCRDACPMAIIVPGAGAYPVIDFARGECTFCGDCARACPTGALDRQPDRSPWAIVARIGDDCLSLRNTVCRSCAEACGPRAIRLTPVLGGAPRPQVEPAQCTGCGACVAVCPTQAVRVAPPESVTPRARKIA